LAGGAFLGPALGGVLGSSAAGTLAGAGVGSDIGGNLANLINTGDASGFGSSVYGTTSDIANQLQFQQLLERLGQGNAAGSSQYIPSAIFAAR